MFLSLFIAPPFSPRSLKPDAALRPPGPSHLALGIAVPGWLCTVCHLDRKLSQVRRAPSGVSLGQRACRALSGPSGPDVCLTKAFLKPRAGP